MSKVEKRRCRIIIRSIIIALIFFILSDPISGKCAYNFVPSCGFSFWYIIIYFLSSFILHSHINAKANTAIINYDNLYTTQRNAATDKNINAQQRTTTTPHNNVSSSTTHNNKDVTFEHHHLPFPHPCRRSFGRSNKLKWRRRPSTNSIQKQQ